MQQKPNLQPASTSLREIDLSYYVSHYLNLIWRWKWYILISAPIVMLGFALYVTKFGSVRPELEAAVVLGMDDTQEMGAVRDIGQSSVQSRLDVIRGRTFLKGIVEKLSLQLAINDLSRSMVFDSVLIDSTAAIGGYQFKPDKDPRTYKIMYTSQASGIKDKIIDQGDVFSLDSLKLPGIYLKFSHNFLKNPSEVNFAISPLRGAIERLRRSLSLLNGSSTRGATSSSIIVKGRDYHLITTTANLIADQFLAKNLKSRRNKTDEVIEILKKQLETATEQLNQSQNALQSFRQQYPNVGLGTDALNSVNNMTQIESNVYSSQLSTKDAQQLRDNLSNISEQSTDINITLNEAITFLSQRNSSAAPVLQAELNQLLQRQQELRMGFDKNHPFVIENRSKIGVIRNKTVSLLDEYILNTATDVSRQKNQVQGFIQRMQGLPSLQLRLAELERQSQVTSTIHSSILTRYNQAKISDAIEVADIFVMDYAVEPIPPPDVVNVMVLLAIGILLGIAVALTPPIIVDFFDKTVRTESELSKILSFTALESLPIIKKLEQTKRSLKNAPIVRGIDKKLITSEYSPDFANEIFRSLRAKIMLRFHDTSKKKILVSSHHMSEGKSLIAANLSITMAQQKLSTVLIDGDIRRGVQHNSFALSKKNGLSSFLFSEEPVTPELVTSLLQTTHVPNLSLISSGQNVPNPSELLSSPRFKELISHLSSMFDVIIFDTPPLGLASDAAIVSDLFSGTLLIIKAGSTNVIELRKKLDEYPNVKNKVIGLVLNEAILDSRMKKYKYSSYYYNVDSFKTT